MGYFEIRHPHLWFPLLTHLIFAKVCIDVVRLFGLTDWCCYLIRYYSSLVVYYSLLEQHQQQQLHIMNEPLIISCEVWRCCWRQFSNLLLLKTQSPQSFTLQHLHYQPLLEVLEDHERNGIPLGNICLSSRILRSRSSFWNLVGENWFRSSSGNYCTFVWSDRVNVQASWPPFLSLPCSVFYLMQMLYFPQAEEFDLHPGWAYAQLLGTFLLDTWDIHLLWVGICATLTRHELSYTLRLDSPNSNKARCRRKSVSAYWRVFLHQGCRDLRMDFLLLPVWNSWFI